MSSPRIVLALVGAAWSLCADAAALGQSAPEGNLPMAPEVLRQRLAEDPFTIAALNTTSGGVMPTQKWTVLFADGVAVDAKWKKAPCGADGWNNSPRRELAAYQLQQLFLPPDEQVVPPAALRCVPLETYRAAAAPSPNVPHGRCVLGLLSAWVLHATPPDMLPDPERFSRDMAYARAFGTLNIFTVLAAHRDAKYSNLLISRDRHYPRMFAVDNGIAFGGTLYNFFTWHLDHLVVGGVPASTIERLRGVTAADIERLQVVAELRADPDGILRPVPPSAPVDTGRGVRWLPDGIQLGLTAEEIAGVLARRRELLDRVDAGMIPTF